MKRLQPAILLLAILAAGIFGSGCGTIDSGQAAGHSATDTAVYSVTPDVTAQTESIEPEVIPTREVSVESFVLTSAAFNNEAVIPVKYSCKGENISPPLSWSNPPAGTVSFALIVDDPDAPGGTWVHWVYYNIPGNLSSLSEGLSSDKELPDGSLQGVNSYGEWGYRGPCPPGESHHHYYFKLYALDTALDHPAGADKSELLKAMQGHILEMIDLMGVFPQ